MLRGQDDAAFDAVMQDLCLAFNRPYSTDVTRVFWESLKHVSLPDVKRLAAKHRATSKKFPTPRELTPDRPTAPPKQLEPLPSMSSWAIAANRVLFSVAYQGNRGFRAMGDRLQSALAAKADYVRMAEDAEAAGDRWEPQEFNRLCREGFEHVLGFTT